MPVRSLRILSAVGAGILLIGVAFVVIAIVAWQPLNTAPVAWIVATAVILAMGLVLTIIATATLAARSRVES